MFHLRNKTTMVDPDHALRGRQQTVPVAARHAVLGTPLQPPFPEGFEQAIFGMGCFWGAERVFWQAPGVYATAVGYAGGFTPNPTYEEVCGGRTGHAEVVLAVFDPQATTCGDLLRLFWENHDPTQGMRRGNDTGTQYRSIILYSNNAQEAAAESSRAAYGERLRAAGHGEITTEIEAAGPSTTPRTTTISTSTRTRWATAALAGPASAARSDWRAPPALSSGPPLRGGRARRPALRGLVGRPADRARPLYLRGTGSAAGFSPRPPRAGS